MNNQREETDLRDVLKRSVEAGETILITGGGSSAALEAAVAIEDLAREVGKTARVAQTGVARIVQFDASSEADGAGLIGTNTEQAMSQQAVEQTVDNERERWASNLSSAMRSLRKFGFLVVRDPNGAVLSGSDQERQAREAACWLLAVPATSENLATPAVHELGRALLEMGEAELNRIRGTA